MKNPRKCMTNGRSLQDEGGLDNMTLREYEEEGGCNGCMFYQNIEPETGKVCTFHWFDDESGDWDYGKNCDEISD